MNATPALEPDDGTALNEWAVNNEVTVANTSDSVARWFARKFPKLPAEFGEAVLEEPDKDGRQIVSKICQSFLAATMGDQGSPETPTVYIPAENRFWTYVPSEGVFMEQREQRRGDEQGEHRFREQARANEDHGG